MKFKVGDRVENINEGSLYHGATGVIKEIRNDWRADPLLVVWFDHLKDTRSLWSHKFKRVNRRVIVLPRRKK